MRLKENISNYLSEYVKSTFSNSKIFLFGSRVDDNQKGGDIDILILTEQKLSFSDLSKMGINFYKNFGEQKIDIVNFTFDEEDSFKNIALSQAVEL